MIMEEHDKKVIQELNAIIVFLIALVIMFITTVIITALKS